MEAAAARAVRAAAETLTGVRAGSCRIAVRPQDGAPPAPAGRLRRGPVEIRLEVQVALTRNLQEVAERVRRRVLEAAATELGMPVATVDVTIIDLIDVITDDSNEMGDGVEGWRP